MKTLFRTPVPAFQKARHVSIANTNWLILYSEISAVRSESHMKAIYKIRGQHVELF
jgi:hypothetical protein